MTVQISLNVNDNPVQMDYFVAGFVDHILSGIIEALEDTTEIKDLDLSIDDDKVTIKLNGALVPINDFVNTIIKGTITGMVSTLKGVNGIGKLNISLHK